MWGKLLEKNIATFRCYGTVSPAKRVRSPTPLPKNFHKGSFWESNIGRICALPFCFMRWICQHVHHFPTRAFRALGSRERLGTTNPIRSESCFV